MFQDVTKPPPPLPAMELKQLDAGISVLSPLVRRGTGPPLIILAADNDDSINIVEGVPSLLVKWAEEGFGGPWKFYRWRCSGSWYRYRQALCRSDLG
jgi:carboxymethylenebutenolidase